MRKAKLGRRQVLEWYPITNFGESDEREDLSGRSRFSTTNFDMMEALELNPNKHHIVSLRLLLDARLGAIADWTTRSTSKRALKRSRLPTEYCWDARDVLRVPNYFMMGTGNSPLPIWICDRSYYIPRHSEEEKKKLISLNMPENAFLPPHSVFFAAETCLTPEQAGAMIPIKKTTPVSYILWSPGREAPWCYLPRHLFTIWPEWRYIRWKPEIGERQTLSRILNYCFDD